MSPRLLLFWTVTALGYLYSVSGDTAYPQDCMLVKDAEGLQLALRSDDNDIARPLCLEGYASSARIGEPRTLTGSHICIRYICVV